MRKLKASHPLWAKVSGLSSSLMTTSEGRDCVVRSAIIARALGEGFSLVAGRRALRYGSASRATMVNAPEASPCGGDNGTWPWHCWIAHKNVWIDVQTGADLEFSCRKLDALEKVATMPKVWPFGPCLIVAQETLPIVALENVINSHKVGWAYMPDEAQTAELRDADHELLQGVDISDVVCYC